MNVTESQKSIKFSLSITEHEYLGEKDENNFRNGEGEQEWRKEGYFQQYTGQFLNDCLHNYGTYKWYNIKEKCQLTYKGQFFANNLEGYGISSFPDGTIFEGLFKNNERFGPGITSYENGTQDVGLWKGCHLIRLNQSLEENIVPCLAETVKGRAYLLNFKFLVPVQEKKDDIGTRILKSLNSKEDVLRMNDKLYNRYVRNPNSTFFNYQEYEKCCNIHDTEDWSIDVCDSKENIIKKILVTNLIAWNNEELAISIMQHTFKHRNSENSISFEVSDTLVGERTIFKEPGFLESRLLELLQSCCQGNTTMVEKLISYYDLYPDISDYQGNNSIIYAAASNQPEVIQILTNFGANVDHVNDECLTALIISILRYMAFKFDVTNWELSFLPSVESKETIPEVQEWNTRKVTKPDIEEEQVYLFDLSCKHPIEVKKAKTKPKKENIKEKKRISIKEIQEPEEKVSTVKNERLNQIIDTVDSLLKCGSKPNYGECPFPPLILSVFANSPEIINLLLQFGADTNIRTAHHLGSLTPLHIIASLAPSADTVSAALVLLENGADTNLAANTIHWEEEKTCVLAGRETEDDGKTPLHLLCMRYDFINDSEDYLGELGSLFIDFGADPFKFYLGHTYLTLALIRGNTKLMHQILNSGVIDPNSGLGNNMGVPLTVLILTRYESILPPNICEKIYDILLEYYANPLNNVPLFYGNTIEFCREENIPAVSSVSVKGKKEKPTKTKKHQQIINILQEAGETTLDRQIKKTAVQVIYQYHIECRFEDTVFDQIVKFLTLNIAQKYLQMLLDHDAIFASQTFCIELLKFVSTSSTKTKPSKGKDKSAESIYELVDEIDFNKTVVRAKQFKTFVPVPEMDPDVIKFKVCFECLHKTNKTLLLCPACNLVYFCSQECNLKNINRKVVRHPCKVPFYNKEFALMQERLARGESEPISKFQRFHDLRKELIAADPDYFKKLAQYDKEKTEIRETEREALRALQGQGKKGKGKGDKRKGGDGDRDGKKGGRRGKEKEGKESKKKRKHSKDDERKKGKKRRDRSASRKDKQKRRKGSRDTSKSSKKSGKIAAKDKRGRSKDKKEKQKIEKEKYKETKSSRSSSVSSSIRRDSRDRRDERTPLDGLATDKFRDAVFDACQIYDEKYFAMFMPYCICVNGQLFYKFKGCQGYRELTYSDI